MIREGERMTLHSIYKEWVIWAPSITGWWSANKAGQIRLLADTLSGLRQLISEKESV